MMMRREEDDEEEEEEEEEEALPLLRHLRCNPPNPDFCCCLWPVCDAL